MVVVFVVDVVEEVLEVWFGRRKERVVFVFEGGVYVMDNDVGGWELDRGGEGLVEVVEVRGKGDCVGNDLVDCV